MYAGSLLNSNKIKYEKHELVLPRKSSGLGSMAGLVVEYVTCLLLYSSSNLKPLY